MATLRINIATASDIIADFEASRNPGKPTYSFATWQDLHAALTPNRVAILAAMKNRGGMTMREVSRLVKRDFRPVHADLAGLLKIGLLDRHEAGVIFPYTDVHIDISDISKAA
ncbi:hypothetical protein [Neorhizobium alkalisoli]|uniref:Putative transcriptional regulator n=1 Tax=Neorhizobium alkalisoli TaxID=528178 RepID=A0A561QVF4_9HYPH|nr:hypothetical protein [Neorhizobium alkalisoli]TWF54363.1 putative transcriptional regulator [Neorhizobium alkalisoli]